MNRSFLTVPVMLLVVALAAPPATAKEAAPSAASLSRESVVKGNTRFAVQLYRELGAREGNLFFSPLSVSLALGMTYAGARGNTAKEMKETLHLQLDQAALHPAFKSLNKELAANASRTGQKLNIANALVLTGGNASSEFKTILKDDYDAEIFPGKLDTINNWVKQKTEGKIEKILGELSPNSVCVLLNAVYFKGTWESRFENSRTRDLPFTVSAAKQVTAPLMYQKGSFKMLTGDDFDAISLPYRGNDLSMVILLPAAFDGLAAMEKQLTADSLKEWLARLDSRPERKADLYLPKFKLETGYDLGSSFDTMGMHDAFSPSRADFSGMGWPQGRLWISQIKHKAFVLVNEEGTEAAAATAVEMATKSMRHDPVFRADHPFFFMIRDNRSGTILFMGRMVNPV